MPLKRGGTTKHCFVPVLGAGLFLFGKMAAAATNEYAHVYDAAALGRPSERLALALLPTLDIASGARALDLGCGPGDTALALAEHGLDVLALDAGAAMLALAEARARDRQLPLRTVQRDMRHLGTARELGGLFDLVVCLGGTLNELAGKDDLGRLFRGVGRVLKQSGVFVFDLRRDAENEHDAVLHDSADLMVYRSTRYDAGTLHGSAQVGWMVRETERWWRGEHIVALRAWADDEIAAAATSNGFTVVPWQGDEDAGRAVWLARR